MQEEKEKTVGEEEPVEGAGTQEQSEAGQSQETPPPASETEVQPPAESTAPGEETGAGGAPSRLMELARRYSGEDVASDDEALELIEEELEDLSDYKENNNRVNAILKDALDSEPDFGDLIGYILQGATLEEAVAKTVDLERLAEAGGGPDYPKWAKHKEERLERLKRMQEEDERNAATINRINENMPVSKQLIVDFAKEKGLSDEETSEMAGKLAAFANDIMEMKVSKDVLDMIYKSMKMNEIMEDAREEGAVEERNKKIETARANKTKTDGLPQLEGGQGGQDPKEKDDLDSFFDGVIKRRSGKNF